MKWIDMDVMSDELLGRMVKDSLDSTTVKTGEKLRKKIIEHSDSEEKVIGQI